MQDQKSATLTTVFSEVLANLAFMFTDEAPPEPPPGDVWLETTIAYSGPAAGTLRLWCTRGFSTRLAANLLGTDPDTEQSTEDAVKEFMNIGPQVLTCGTKYPATHPVPKGRGRNQPPLVTCRGHTDTTGRIC